MYPNGRWRRTLMSTAGPKRSGGTRWGSANSSSVVAVRAREAVNR
jgi:hypothetical protein